MAANSDSTLTNSHGVSSPVFTSWESPSTMCVCGEIGYAQMTSGRHSATTSATAREPSSCLSMDSLPKGVLHVHERHRGRRRVALADPPGEAIANRRHHGLEPDLAGERREAAQQR